MQVKDFLDLVLPSAGNRVISVRYPSGAFQHRHFGDNAQCAQAIAVEDAQQNHVYLAPNSFGPPVWNPTKGKDRTGGWSIALRSNVAACRSLYDDFDVGPEGYPDKESAWEAALNLEQLLRVQAWIVDSGGGYHFYIVMNRDMERSEWETLSHAKRRITRHFDFAVDKSVDMQAAHTLRPVGTLNRKYSPPHAVTLAKEGLVYDPGAVRDMLNHIALQNAAPYVPGLREPLPPRPAWLPDPGEIGNPFAGLGRRDHGPPSDPHAVAEKCAAVRALRDARGQVPEPHWRLALGVLKFCEDGERVAQEWSSGHPQYSAEETRWKLESWNSGPTTCDTMDAQIGCRAACPFAGHCKSPVQLGKPPEDPPPPPPEPGTAVMPTQAAEPDMRKALPAGFSWNANLQLLFHTPLSAEGEETKKSVPVAHQLFWVLSRAFNPVSGEWEITWGVEDRGGVERQFATPTSVLADARTFSKAMAAQEVFMANHPQSRNVALKFGVDLINRMQQRRESVQIRKQMGWVLDRDDRPVDFALGTERIGLAESDTAVHYDSKVPPDFAVPFHPKGSLSKWVANIDRLLNRPGAEPWQFALCHSMGSVLVRLAGASNWNGIPLAFTGSGGTGKTTACKIAVGFYGQPKMLERQAGTQGSTINAVIARIKTSGDVPILLDEMSDLSSTDLARVLYALANGRDKEGLNSAREFANHGDEWHKNAFITSNDSIYGVISRLAARHKAEATQLRVFEVPLPSDFIQRVFPDVLRTDPESGLGVEDHMDGCYGAPVRPFLRHVMASHDSIRQALRRRRADMRGGTHEDDRERFYRDAVATAMVAGETAAALNLIRFDLKALEAWALDRVRAMRESRRDLNLAMDEYVNSFLLGLNGRLIVTPTFKSAGGPMTSIPGAELQQGHRGARLHDGPEVLRVGRRAVGLLRRQGRRPGRVRGRDGAAGMLVLRPEPAEKTTRITLGAWTVYSSSQARCYELNYDKVRGKAGLALVATQEPVMPSQEISQC